MSKELSEAQVEVVTSLLNHGAKTERERILLIVNNLEDQIDKHSLLSAIDEGIS
jgi:hypothetical protein